jgi:hypothetical protein
MAFFKIIYMKTKLLISLIFFAIYTVKGQSIEIDKYQIQVTTGLNQPGFVHENLSGSHKVGTIFKNNDAYIQTFTNTPLSFGSGYLNQHLIFQTDGNTVIPNYAEVGEVLIRQKKLVGVMDAYDQINASTNDGTPFYNKIPHNLDASKIISVRLMINTQGAGLQYYAEEHTYWPNVRAGVRYDATDIFVYNYPNQSQYIRGSPVKIFITYRK